MKEVTIKNGITELGIIEKNNDGWVTSNFLADYFDKRHDNLLPEIEKIIKNLAPDFSAANFKKTTYKNRGKKYPCYMLNRKSFVLLAMGFTGEKALKFKVAYIEAFEDMSNLISTRLISKDGYKEMAKAIGKHIGDIPRKYSTEANLINEIVLGMSAANFKKLNDIDETSLTRDNMAVEKLEQLDKAQRLNAQLITAGMSFTDREIIIKSNYKI